MTIPHDVVREVNSGTDYDLRTDRALIQQNRLAIIGEIIGTIVHKWQQPLNTVALLMQNIQADFHSGALTQEHLDTDIDEAMNVLLDLSRSIEEFRNYFRQDKDPQGFILNRAVNYALTLLEPVVTNNKIKIETKADVVVNASGSQNEFVQVLLSLILNSWQAALERKITHHRIFITISREHARPVVYIRDNCGGIAADVMPEIFKPFYTTRDPDRGAGLGLYVARIIIEQNMGGNLTARNLSGGAEFRIEL